MSLFMILRGINQFHERHDASSRETMNDLTDSVDSVWKNMELIRVTDL